jgi:hypothetical protein
MKVAGGDFAQAKIRVAELLDRPDLVQASRSKTSKGGRLPLPTTLQHRNTPGCMLAAYAEAKHLPIEFLQRCRLTEITYGGTPAMRIRRRQHLSSDT